MASGFEKSVTVTPVLPPEVVDLLRGLIRRSDVRSVSFPFADDGVWRLLIEEQIARANHTGLTAQEAFGLSGPDSGLPFNPADWDGCVPIPFEAAAEAVLFVKPPWYGYQMANAMGTGDLAAAMLGQPFRHVLLKGQHREVDSASRIVSAGWILYSSTRCNLPCQPFLTS